MASSSSTPPVHALSDARAVYAAIASQAGAADGAESSRLASLNKLVLRRVAAATKGPLRETASTVRSNLHSARSVLADVRSLPSVLEADISSLPDALSLGSLTTSVPAQLSRLLAALRAAVDDPSTLFPRLPCGEIPVDPAKTMRLVKQYRLLDALSPDSDHDDAAATTTDREIKTSHDAISSLSDRVAAAVAPVTDCVDALTSVQQRLAAAREKVMSDTDDARPLQSVVDAEERVSTIVTSVRNLIGKDEDDKDEDEDDDDDSVDEDARAMRGAALTGDADAVSVLEQGMGVLQRARESGGLLDEAGALMAQFVDGVKALWDEVKDIFAKVVAAVKAIASALKKLIGSLPRFLAEVQKLFFPRGLYALLLRPSDDAQTLVSGLRDLRGALPNPDDLEARAEGLLNGDGGGGSVRSVSRATDTIGKIAEVTEKPKEMARDVLRLADDMPETVGTAAKEAVAEWAAETGADVAQDFAQGIAHKVGGQVLGDVVGGFFGRGDDGGKEGGGDNGGDGDAQGEDGGGLGNGALLNMAGGLVDKIF